MRPSAEIVGFRFRLAKANLSGQLRQAVRSMTGGKWGSAGRALRAVLEVLGVSERAGEIGTVRTIDADWFYALGPRQRNRVRQIVQDIVHLQRWVGDEDVAQRMVPQMEDLVKEVAWMEKLVRDPGEGFQHGPFKIVTMAGVRRKDVDEVLEALDKATKVVQAKFPKLLYGDVYIAKTLSRGFGSLARYMPSSDTLIVSLKARGAIGDVYAICHELGHRYDRKFWKNKDSRSRFWGLSTNPKYEVIEYDAKLRKDMADEFIDAIHARMGGKPMSYSSMLTTWMGHLMGKHATKLRDLTQKALKGNSDAEGQIRKIIEGKGKPVEVQTDKEIRGPLHVTTYGAKNVSENFAEAFAHYVLGKQLPAEIAEVMGRLR